MGYVSLKDICKFISPAAIQKTAGTWTPTLSSHLILDIRAAAAEGFYLLIPITLPASDVGKQCARLLSVDIWYKVGTAALADAAVPVCKKQTLSANGTAVAGAAYTAITLDADHDTDAELVTEGDHKMTVTFSNQPYLEDDEVYYLVCYFEGAATSVFSLAGAQANFELRL